MSWDWWFGENSMFQQGPFDPINEMLGIQSQETPSQGGAINPDIPWTSVHNYTWDGSGWQAADLHAHSGADHSAGPPSSLVADDGQTYYPHPIISPGGKVWRWDWKTSPASLIGSGASLESGTMQGFGERREYDFEDIYGLSQSDPESVVDQFMSDLGLLPTDVDRGVLIEELKNMPKSYMQKAKELMGESKEEYQSDIYGIQKQLGSGRQQVASAAGMSGVRSPSAGGFKGMQDITEGAYEQMGEAKRGYESSIYGLEQDVESKFSQWLNNLLS